MTPTLKLGTVIAALTFGTAATAHDTPCNGSVDQWQSRDAVVAAAETAGITAKRIHMRGSCFIVLGQNGDGDRAAVGFKADTLEQVELPDPRDRRGKRRGPRDGKGRMGHHGKGPMGQGQGQDQAPAAPTTDN